MYKYYNANSHGNLVNDCTIRAISLATYRSWDDTYRELANEARKMGLMMDSTEFIEEYLDERFYRECYHGTTLEQFISTHQNGIFIISMPGHLSAVIDGVNYDTFNPRSRTIWCSWEVERD